MLAAIVLAAALPLGVWPADAGPAASVVDEVEFYLVEPEDDYSILATQQLAPPLATAEPASLKSLAALAERLGADGVVLLAELAEKDIPKSPDEPLPAGKRLVTAVFVVFDSDSGGDQGPTLAGRTRHRAVKASPQHHLSASRLQRHGAPRRDAMCLHGLLVLGRWTSATSAVAR
jgi:hypothetical protein